MNYFSIKNASHDPGEYEHEIFSFNSNETEIKGMNFHNKMQKSNKAGCCMPSSYDKLVRLSC